MDLARFSGSIRSWHRISEENEPYILRALFPAPHRWTTGMLYRGLIRLPVEWWDICTLWGQLRRADEPTSHSIISRPFTFMSFATLSQAT